MRIKMKEIVKQAKERRYEFLLLKVKKDECLSRAEIKELEILEAGARAHCLVSTIPQLAGVFHVTTRAVDKWVAEGCPKTSAGNFDITEIVKWRMNRAKIRYKKW